MRITKRKAQEFGKRVHNPSPSYLRLQLTEEERELRLQRRDIEDVERTDNAVLGCVDGLLVVLVVGLVVWAGLLLLGWL